MRLCVKAYAKVLSRLGERARAPVAMAVRCAAALGLAICSLSQAQYVQVGALNAIAGTIAEWDIPTPEGSRDPAIAPDGSVYFAEPKGDHLARFDPKSGQFREWNLAKGTQPHGVAVAASGKVYFGGRGTGVLGELDPQTGAIQYFPTPTPSSGPYTVMLGPDGAVWIAERAVGRVARFDRSSRVFTEYPVDGEPYGLAVDKRGIVWVTRLAADKLSSINPATGKITDLSTGAGSKPRRVAVAPDGMLWVSLYGHGKLLKVDPTLNAKIQEYALPGGVNAGPYAVDTDAAGRVWVTEFQKEQVSIFDHRTEKFRTIGLPKKAAGVRNTAIDSQGRFWFIGTTSGKLGMIQ